jgi:hypothetical protein
MVQNLREVLSLEKDLTSSIHIEEDRYNVGMPYMMVVPQEVNHISSIEKLFSAYDLESDGKLEYSKQTMTLRRPISSEYKYRFLTVFVIVKAINLGAPGWLVGIMALLDIAGGIWRINAVKSKSSENLAFQTDQQVSARIIYGTG